MEYKRMSTKDMLQYCDEALAWDQFGPVDIFFFESVKRILLGQCSAVEMAEPEEPDVLAEVKEPVTAEELIEYENKSVGFVDCLSEDGFFERSTDYVMTDAEGKDEN